MSMLKEVMAEVGISVEEFQAIPPVETLVEETVVSPVDSPSSTIPVEVGVPVVETVEVPVEEATALGDALIQGVVSEHEILQERAEQLVALQTAMETYGGLIRKAGFSGITPQTAEFIQVQLRSASKVLGTTTKIGSMESFKTKDLREQHDLATVSLEDIRATGKAALDKFLAIVEKIIEFIKRAGQNLYDGVTVVDRAVDQLDKQLAGIKTQGTDAEISIPVSMFKLGGTVHREVSPEIHGLAHFVSTSYPDVVVKFLDGMTKGVLKFDPDGSGAEEIEAFFDEYSKPLTWLIEQEADKDELPGGYKLDISENKLAVGISGPSGGDAAGAEALPVRKTVELRKQVRELKALLTQVRDIRPSTEKISQAGKRLIEGTKRAMAKNGEGNEQAYLDMAKRAGQLVQESSPRTGEIINYIIRYVKAQCYAIGLEIAAIQKSATTEE